MRTDGSEVGVMPFELDHLEVAAGRVLPKTVHARRLPVYLRQIF